MQIKPLSLSQIVLDDLQPRQEGRIVEIEDLAKDMAERGQIYPVIVTEEGKKGKYLLQDGERRYRAAKMIKWNKINTIIIKSDSKLEEYELQFVANAKRKGVTIKEMAVAVKRFVSEFLAANKKKTKNDAIDRLNEITGYSYPYFQAVQEINDAPKLYRDAVYDNKFPSYGLIEIAKATKDEAKREGVRKGYVETEKVTGTKPGANTVRGIKRQLNKISNSLPDKDREELARDILLDSVEVKRDSQGRLIKGNFNLVIQKIESWYDELDQTPLGGFSEKELDQIASLLIGLVERFKAKRRKLYGAVGGKKYKVNKRPIHKTAVAMI